MALVVISSAWQVVLDPSRPPRFSFYPLALGHVRQGDFPARHVPRVLTMFEHLIEQPNVLFAAWRRFGVYLFEGPISIGDIDKLEMTSSQFFPEVPGQDRRMRRHLPERRQDDERAAGTHEKDASKRWESRRLASATVILATDLVGSMQRSVLTGLQLITRPPHPTKVFPKVDEAILWLAPYLAEACGIDATYPKVMAGIHEMSQRFESRTVKRQPRRARS